MVIEVGSKWLLKDVLVLGDLEVLEKYGTSWVCLCNHVG